MLKFNLSLMVTVAQLVEPSVVVRLVVGSSPISHPQKFSGCSVVRLAHLLWEQGVAGSNPATPTKFEYPYIFSKLVL